MDLNRFRISKDTGFILEAPATELPPYFKSWDKLAGDMVELIPLQLVRRRIDGLPFLNVDKLDECKLSAEDHYRAMRLAHLQLTTLVSGYVWSEGDCNAPKILPKQIAIPFWKICERLGVKAGISHMAVALANYQIIDPVKVLRARNQEDNMKLVSFKVIPDFGNDWFFLNTLQLELDFAPALPAISSCLMNTNSQFSRLNLINSLEVLTNSLEKMEETLRKMPNFLYPEVFFNGLRPYLAGFTSGPYADWGGIIFEGVEVFKPQAFSGGSAAQSSIFQCIDGFLGIKHENSCCEEKRFLVDMRDYMPVNHREFLELVEKSSLVRETVTRNLWDSELVSAYNRCVDALVSFRNAHIRVVAKYILGPKNRAVESRKISAETDGGKTQNNNEMVRSRSFESLDNVGTGGTGVMPFLKSIRDATEKAKLSAKKN